MNKYNENCATREDFYHQEKENKMKQATRMGHIPNDPILSQMKPTRGYQSPLNLYLDYIEEYLSIYNTNLDKTKVKGYDSWIDQLFQWTKRRTSVSSDIFQLS